MAFTISSLANNAMQLQMQQMLGNLAAVSAVGSGAGMNASNPALSMAHQQPSSSVITLPGPSSTKENKQVVPMDIESPAENKQLDALVTSRDNGNVNMMQADNIFTSVMGLSGSTFPIIHTGMIDPALLNLQMMMSHAAPQGVTAQYNKLPEVPGPSTSTTTSASSMDKSAVHLKSVSMYPPAPGTKPSTRQKPNGCRTVFVGGIPDNTGEV